MRYVILFRGINVGGNNTVSMKELKKHFEQAGYTHVITYINSGNVILESNDSKDHIKTSIENLVQKEFNVKSDTLVLEDHEFKRIEQSIPFHFENNSTFVGNVLFYYEDLDLSLVDAIKFKPEYEEVVKLDCALIHGIRRVNHSKSQLLRLIGTNLYKKVTIRNVNTVRKLSSMLT